jgi:hypothetical protein
MRSDDAIAKETPCTCPKIAPDNTGNDVTVSEELSRETAPPDVAAPITKPEIVIVTADAGMEIPLVVTTRKVLVVGLQNAVRPLILVLPADTVGTIDEAKNPDG